MLPVMIFKFIGYNLTQLQSQSTKITLILTLQKILKMKSVFITLAMASAALGAVTPAHDAGLARAAIPSMGNVYWHACG